MGLSPPKNVSVLIRLSRWCALLAGIRHGYLTRQDYAEKALEDRKEKSRIKAEMAPILKAEKERMEKRDINYLQGVFIDNKPEVDNEPVESDVTESSYSKVPENKNETSKKKLNPSLPLSAQNLAHPTEKTDLYYFY